MSRNLPVVPRPAADRPDLLRPTRRSTPSVSVGGVLVGSAHPIVVQSMTNTDTADAVGTAAQVAHRAAAGSQIVRVTVNNEEAAAAVPEIVRRLADEGVTVPIVGDFHYNGHKLLAAYPATAAALAKYRINPGNVGTKRRDENFQTIVKIVVTNGYGIIFQHAHQLDLQLASVKVEVRGALKKIARIEKQCIGIFFSNGIHQGSPSGQAAKIRIK